MKRSEPQAPELRHLRTLTRRLNHLERRIEKAVAAGGASGASYDLQERDALRIALQLLELYRAEQTGSAYPTSLLLTEAAEALSAAAADRAELVKALRTRAGLLDDLT